MVSDEDRTKKELIAELAELRSRLARAEADNALIRQGLGPADGTSDRTPLDHSTILINLIDAIPIPVFYKDTEGIFLGYNRAFEEALGLGGESVVGKTIHDVAPGETAEKCSEMEAALLKNPGERVYEAQVRYADGALHDVMFYEATFANTYGEPAGLVCVMTDITDSRREEKRLRGAAEQYREFYEGTKDFIFTSTIDGRLIDLNPAGYEGFGVSTKEELEEINLARDIYNDPRDRERFKKEMAEKGYVKDFEVRINRKKDCTPGVVSLTASVMRDEGGRVVGYRGIVRDVTEQKALEQQLIQSQKMEAIGTLTGGIAHDFNNMIMAITSYATLLLTRYDAKDPHAGYVGQILEATARAANLTKRLLAFSRKRIAALKPERLNNIVTEVEELLKTVIGRGIEFRTRLAEEDFTLLADGAQIAQVLVNLSTNARDAMPDGGALTISTGEVELREDFIKAHGYGEPGRYACISVEDTGSGMAPEVRQKIFDPFFTTKEAGKGTGLGLSIAYGIIKQHNGFINVYSEPGVGTTFKIYLPVAEAPGARPEARSEPMPVAAFGKETVLVAEDDARVRSITKKLLEDSGYNVIDAVDGEDAISKFRQMRDQIELLILDVIMPRKNGREVYNETSKIAPEIKALFVSGYNEDIIFKKGMLDEGLNFLSKPVLPAELLRKVRDVLEQ